MKMKNFLFYVRDWYRRRAYRPGKVISHFIAHDVCRKIKIISIERIDEGLIVGQVQTNNILYVSKGLVEEQKFSEPMTLDIETMWKWSGRTWGGLPDGTSIVDHILEKNAD